MFRVFSHRPRWLLWLVLCLTGVGSIAIYRAASTAGPARIFSPDSFTYINSARALLQTGRFAVAPDTPRQPQIMRTPGYPLFLAGILWFAGERYAWVLFSQLCLHLGTLCLTYHLAARLWNRRTAAWAVVLLALDLASVFSVQQILTETLFTFMLMGTVLAGLTCLSQPRPLSCGLYGLLLASTTMIRPITYYGLFGSLVFFAVVWRNTLTVPYRRIVRLLGVMLLPWLLLIGGWHVRNYQVAGIPEISGIQNYNLLFYRGAGIVARRDHISFEEAQRRLGYGDYTTRHPETRGWSFAQLNARWKHEALTLFKQHPLLLLKTVGWGLLKLLLGPAEPPFLAYVGLSPGATSPLTDLARLSLRDYVQKWCLTAPVQFSVFLAAALHLVALYGGIFSSLVRGWRALLREWPAQCFLGGWIVYFLIISAGPEAYARFRMPIMPLLCLYAAHGLCSLLWRPLPTPSTHSPASNSRADRSKQAQARYSVYPGA